MKNIVAKSIILVLLLLIPTTLALNLETQSKSQESPFLSISLQPSDLNNPKLFLLPPSTTFNTIKITNHNPQKELCPKPQTIFYTTNESRPYINNIDNKDLIYIQPFNYNHYKIGNAEFVRIFVPTTYYNSGYKYTTTSITLEITTTQNPNLPISQKDLSMYIPLIENPSVLDDFNFDGGFQTAGSQHDEQYIIITNELLWNTFNDNFKDWKIAQDSKINSLRIINISEIISEPEYYVNGSWGDATNTSNGNPWIADGEEIIVNYSICNDTQAKIRNFIRYCYNDTNTRYILLGGNYQIVPTRYTATHASGDGCVSYDSDMNHSTDMYYSNLHTSMNNDTDQYWMLNPCCNMRFDKIDWGIDLYVGRVPATNIQQLNYWINKTKAYADGTKTSNYYSNGIDAARANDNSITDNTWYDKGAENSASLGDEFPSNITFVGNQNISATNWSLINDFCNGAISTWDGIALILQSGHCSIGGGLFYDEYNPSTLNNTVYPNFWYGEGCFIGEFGTASICGVQTWMNDQNCTYASIGNSAYGWFGASTYFVEDMMKQMFNESANYNNLTFTQAHAAARTMQGATYADGVWAMIFKETNFFGDPALDWQWQQEGTTTLIVENKTVALGTVFDINVSCQPAQPVSSWEFSLTFDPTLLQVDSVTEGDFFHPFTTLFNSGTTNNTSGNITLMYNLIHPTAQGNASAPGSCINISFTAIAPGTSPINFLYEGVLDPGVTNHTEYVPLTVFNGNVTIQGSAAPQFIFIDNGLNGTTIFNSTPTFNWTIISNTAQYNLQISTSSSFVTFTLNLSNITIYNFPSHYISNATSISFILPSIYSLPVYNTYYCRVRALRRS